MHYPESGLLRIFLPSTWLNKGKKKQLSWMSSGKIGKRPPRSAVFEDGVEDREHLAHAQATKANFFGLPAAKRRS